VCTFLLDAVDFVADRGHCFLPDYGPDPTTGLWRHHDQPREAHRSLRLTAPSNGSAGSPWQSPLVRE
jgi:hypothetical protein